MKYVATAAVAVALALGLSACSSSHEEGVTSNLHSQWTNVNADVPSTTRAAEAVLNEEQLKGVRANSTNVDGTASATKADGTKVKVAVRKEKGNTSQVSVTVGTLGDPALGAEIARKVKDRAERGSVTETPRTTTP
jgi:hypothetical protein